MLKMGIVPRVIAAVMPAATKITPASENAQ